MRISDWSSDVCSSDLKISMNDATRTTMQAAPRHSASPRIEAIAAWLIAALILAGGGIVARLIVDYPQFLPNSYTGFLLYRAGPAATLLWACAAATISPEARRVGKVGGRTVRSRG